MKRNLFLALEGIDGSGKSTQIKMLEQHLISAGHKVYATFEPTDSAIGSLIRKIFRHEMEADHRVIAGLFVADRLNHLLNKENGVLKKLEEGYTVLTDRYYFSSYAYHSVHMPMNWVIEANAMSASLLKPDLNIYIDISPELSMQRINAGRASKELYETVENLTIVSNQYKQAFDLLKSTENIFTTDGNRSEGEIASDIWAAVQKLLQA